MMAVGSRGDVQPYVALGHGLLAAGHDVILATHADFRDFVEEHDLEFKPLAGSPRSMMKSPEGKRVAGSGIPSIPRTPSTIRCCRCPIRCRSC